jgi:hypothetical protein
VIELLASMAHKLPPAATLLAAFAVLLALAAAPLVVVAGDPDMLQAGPALGGGQAGRRPWAH